MVSNSLYFHPYLRFPFWLIFFRWVGSTTNQSCTHAVYIPRISILVAYHEPLMLENVVFRTLFCCLVRLCRLDICVHSCICISLLTIPNCWKTISDTLVQDWNYPVLFLNLPCVHGKVRLFLNPCCARNLSIHPGRCWSVASLVPGRQKRRSQNTSVGSGWEQSPLIREAGAWSSGWIY